MIYFIRAGECGPVKIGKADDVAARLAELQCGNHAELTLLRQVEGGRQTEIWFHRTFAAHRLRGEWFTFHPDMLTVEAPDEAATSQSARPLGEYLKRKGITQGAFAAQVGAHPITVAKWCTGVMLPRAGQLAAIERITEGEVTASALVASLRSEAV
jgi:hypothetical protein